MEERNAAIELFEEWGAIKHGKKTILLMGKEKFGDPTPEQEQNLRSIEELARLDRLSVRLLKVDSWDELLRGR